MPNNKSTKEAEHDQIRKAIDESGLSRLSLSQGRTGVSEATLSKFYLGQRGLRGSLAMRWPIVSN